MIESFQAVLELRLVWAVGITFLGGVMLGYTGFGGAMVSMPLLVFLFGPIEALGIIIIGYSVLLVHLLPAAVRKADWQIIKPILFAIVIFVPIGNWFLFFLDPYLIKKIIGFIIFFFSALILLGWRYRGPSGTVPSAITGAVSGVISGFIGLGGPALVVYIMANDRQAEVQRACILVGMALLATMVFVNLGFRGGFTIETIYRGLVATPTQWGGGVIGAWLFARAPEEIFKKFTLVALIVLGASVAVF